MDPRSERNIVLALALAKAPDVLFERVWAMVFSGQSQWGRFLSNCGFSAVVDLEDQLPIEVSATANGVLSMPCPKGKLGQEAYHHAMRGVNPVGPGSALLYASGQTTAAKLVITDHAWSGADGHRYVAVCDCGSRTVYPELVDDLDSSYTFLIRQI